MFHVLVGLAVAWLVVAVLFVGGIVWHVRRAEPVAFDCTPGLADPPAASLR